MKLYGGRRSAPAARNAPGASRFFRGYLIFVLAFFFLILGGLMLLWKRMDVYERSRPGNAVADFFAAADGTYWRELLAGLGMEESYIGTLDLNDVVYEKDLAAYTDETPAYRVRFGGETLLNVTLKPGEKLPFNSNAWELGEFHLKASGLTVYAPKSAELRINGEPVGAEKLMAENALPVETGPFEEAFRDEFALSKYVLDEIYTVENLTVTDAAGDPLPLSGSEGKNYYFAPLTGSVTVTAPSFAAVMLNGVAVTEENAAVQRGPIPELRAAESFITANNTPETLTWTVDGLFRTPVVEALRFDGVYLTPAEETEGRWVYAAEHDAAFASEVERRILTVFDAYAAYTTNKNGKLEDNYQRYVACLVPGSDAADRAYRAKESVYWATGRSAAVESVTISEVIRWAEDCFTAKVNFTLVTDETEDENGYLIVFVRYNGEWRAVSVQ